VRERAVLILVVGPSGAGKDTLMEAARAELASDARFRFARREITRPADAGGEAHLAIDPASFAVRKAQGGYALSWEAHGLHYGIPADIAHDLRAGRVVVANVSRGVIAEAVRNFNVTVLEITAPPELLARRLALRGRETAGDVALRLQRSVTLPQGVCVETIMNDAGIAEGAAGVVAVLTRAAESARPA
jgi:phosphonate metabolism protein PhnN/1,5-bisphosphokinase (PRPP-forming)